MKLLHFIVNLCFIINPVTRRNKMIKPKYQSHCISLICIMIFQLFLGSLSRHPRHGFEHHPNHPFSILPNIHMEQ